MTDEEKKAAEAAKAAADAKAKADAEAAAKAAAESEPEDEPDDKATIPKSEFEAFKAKSNKENEKHRLAGKKVAEEFEAFKKTVGAALGLGPAPGVADPAAALRGAEAKQRGLLLRGEFIAAAAKAGSVDPSGAYELARGLLKDVKVSVDEETVDGEGIAEAVEKLKETKPYLFGTAGSGTEGEPAPSKRMPDGPGNPAKGGGTAYANWQALVKSGRQHDANQFYATNKKAISATWPK